MKSWTMQSKPLKFLLALLVMLAGLVSFFFPTPARAVTTPQPVIDRGLETRFQDTFGGFHKRGRALVASDFDLDGRIDFFVGNIGDPSLVLRQVETPGGYRFEVVQKLFEDELAFAAVSADFDNDGDYDLFVATGGMDGRGFDYLFQNTLLETGELKFVDVTEKAGVKGPIFEGQPIRADSFGATVADYNRDGYVDIFVNVANHGVSKFWSDKDSMPEGSGRNILWQNNGNGTFTNVAAKVGITGDFANTTFSTFLDFDNDGDADLFENNLGSANILWRNLQVEIGFSTFEDVTEEFSQLPNEDLRFPEFSFASTAADFNNDGWEDIMVFSRAKELEKGSPYPLGHALFLNQGGRSFKNVATLAGLNYRYKDALGVMGCQVGDVNRDGFPDVFMGNGGPLSGLGNDLFWSVPTDGEIPSFQMVSHLIDFAPPKEAGIDYAPYPYRTHGTTFVDVDNDGDLEIASVNGGAFSFGAKVREPNRLFHFPLPPSNFLKIRPIGDGINVSLDAIGTRLALTVSTQEEISRTIYGTLMGGSCFSAQNGFEVPLSIGEADKVEQLEIRWPDGFVETIHNDININTSIIVKRSASHFQSTKKERQRSITRR